MTDTSRVAPTARSTRVVDVHAHAVPLELLAALRSGRTSLPELGDDDRIRIGSRWTSPLPAALTDVPARLAEMDRMGAITPGEKRPASTLRRLYFDSLTHSPEVLSWLVDFAGSDRVLLGSDYPFPTGDAAAVRTVELAPLAPAVRAAVLGGNAARLSLTPEVDAK